MSIPLISLLAGVSLMLTQMPPKDVADAGGFIYLSNTLALDDGGALVGGGDIAAQTRRVIERTRVTLEAAGSSLDRVVAVTVYLKSASDFAAMNEAYRVFWPEAPPTRTTIIADVGLPGALVGMAMIGVPRGAERAVIHPSAWKASPNPYSYAIKSGDTLFLSGLVSRNARENSVVAGDVRTQTKVIMDSAGELLQAAGMTHANIVSARVFLTDTATFQRMNEVYRSYFPTAPPARATVQSGLAGDQYGVEITIVASSAKRDVITDGRPPNPNLSPGIRAGSRLYLSGALGNTPENKRDVAAQTRETFAKLERALSAAGLTPADVVDALVYVTDLTSAPEVEREYRAFFGSSTPARTVVRSGLMSGDGLVEIMLTAVKR